MWRGPTVRGLTEQIEAWRRPPAPSLTDLPDRFRDIPADRIMQFLSSDFYPGNLIVADSAAAGGKSLRLRDTSVQGHGSPPVFGLFDEDRNERGPTLTIAKEDIPQDGLFHLYKVGRWRILPGTRLWGHKSWLVSCLELENAYSPPGPDAPANANEWEVWVSAKFTGPAYIRDSRDTENGYFMDRIILVKPTVE
jgi:hypothetical protein